MNNSYKKKFYISPIILLIPISFYSFFINFYYANLGVFPIDTFLHYDSSYRILKGEYPLKDYWIVSGLSIDAMQAFFFKILGINWVSYIIHSSLFNSIIAILTFYFFLSLEINEIKSFIYTVSFSTLSYTISGTPFVDQHATFFLLISTYFLLNALTNSKKNLLWFFSIFFKLFSFLSKQVPATYAIILQGSIILFYSFFNKNFLILKLVLISFFFYSNNFFINFICF